MAKVKMFLQKWIINNIGFKILALVFAFVLWLVITNTTDPVTTRTISGIPVEIVNEQLVMDGSHVYTVVSGSTATVVVSGNRSIVGNLTVSDFTATADFAELSITNAVPIHIELTGEKARYASSVTITQKTNSMIISIEEMAQLSLTVEVQFTGEAPEDMIVEDAVCSPAQVTFHAPESVIKEADKAVVQINYSEFSGDTILYKDVTVYDRDGGTMQLDEENYLDPPSVAVKITTNRIKNVPIHLDPSGAVADGYQLTDVIFSKNSISIRGDAETLNAISEIVLPSELLNIQGAKEDVSVTVDVSNYLPQGVTVYGDTGTVTVTAVIAKTEEETTTQEETTTEEETTTSEG